MNLTLDKSDPKPTLGDVRRGRQTSGFHGTHEADFHFNGGEVFGRKQRAAKRDAHRGVSQGRHNTTVDPTHGIVEPLITFQMHDGVTARFGDILFLRRDNIEANQLGNRCCRESIRQFKWPLVSCELHHADATLPSHGSGPDKASAVKR